MLRFACMSAQSLYRATSTLAAAQRSLSDYYHYYYGYYYQDYYHHYYHFLLPLYLFTTFPLAFENLHGNDTKVSL
jgi:hypothetical protein